MTTTTTDETRELAAAAADPRQKLIALIQWMATPDSPFEIPEVITMGFVTIPAAMLARSLLPSWIEKVQNMKPEDLDRTVGNVLQIATRVRDPNMSAADFEAWLPRGQGSPRA